MDKPPLSCAHFLFRSHGSCLKPFSLFENFIMTISKASQALLSVLVLGITLTGCTTTARENKHAVSMVDSKSAFDTDQPNWKTPFWEKSSGDQSASSRAPSFVKRDEPLSNVGLLVAPSVADVLPQSIADQAGEHGLLVLPQSMLSDALNHDKGCTQPGSDACLSALAVYPGVRLLAKLSPGDNGRVTVQVWDTRLGKSYTQSVSADGQGARQLLDNMAGQAAAASWSMQPFAGGEGSLYISSGRVNGLAEGAELAVREPGQAVRTPSGQVVAWRSGKIVGKAKVSRWVGATLSIVTAESGTAPGPGYRLTLMSNQ